MDKDGLNRIPVEELSDKREFMMTAKKLTDWEKEPSVLDLKDDLLIAKQAHTTHKAKIKHWNDLREISGNVKPTKRKNRSVVQPRTVRKTAEWRYSALTEPFLSTAKLFKFNPETHRDEEAAAQSESLVNWQFRTKMNKIKFIDEYIRTAVDEGTVFVRLGWDRQVEMEMVETPIYSYVPVDPMDPQAGQQIQQAMAMKEEDPAGFFELDPALQESVNYSMEMGMPVQAIVVGSEQVEEEKVIKNQPTVEIVNNENMFVDPSCKGDLSLAKYVICSFETTKADLIKDGRYKNLDTVNWSASSVLSEPDHESKTPSDYQTRDDLRKPVVAYEYWGELDINGDDMLVPVVCTWIGDTMIRCELNPFPDQRPPFICATYMPIKQTFWGEPDAELLEDNQAILGALTRGMIDLMGRSANSQMGMAKGFLDVTNRRRFQEGLDYEFNPGSGDPRVSVHQHTYPEIPASAMNMMTLQNHEAEGMSGVKAFSGGLSGEAYGEVAAGIKGMLDAAALREMGILRRLADGLKLIGTKIASMNVIFLSEEETVQVTDRVFVQVSREKLKGNYDTVVDIATAEVDERRAQDLGFMLQTMGPDMNPELSKEILGEIAELKRMPGLAHKIRTFQPEPDPAEEKAKQLELAKMEAEISKLESETAENRAQAAKYQAEADQLELAFVHAQNGTDHARDMEKASQQARAQQDLAVTNALLQPQKPDEKGPDVESAIGYNSLTEGRGVL